MMFKAKKEDDLDEEYTRMENYCGVFKKKKLDKWIYCNNS